MSVLPADFKIVIEARRSKDGDVHVAVVTYKGEAIALFKPGSDMTPERYIEVYGYLAEWRRRRNNGEDIGWSDDLRINSFHASPGLAY